MRGKTLDFLRFPYTMFTGGMMNEKNTEGKKQEEKAMPKPWLVKKTEELIALDKEGNTRKLEKFIEGFLSGITQEYLSFHDIISSKGKLSEKFARIRAWHDIFFEYIGFFTRLKVVTITAIIKTWIKIYDSTELQCRNKAVDQWLFENLRSVKEEKFSKIESRFQGLEGLTLYMHLQTLGNDTYKDDPEMLDTLCRFLEITSDKRSAIDCRARIQALMIKEELKEETTKEINMILANTRESFNKDTDAKIEKFKENIQGVEARFIQIIGIFAAIIAFIVTMVPTAARLGGASIPIALAGLAIVTAGIIVLLAMIFGKDERRKSLSKGLTGIIIAFILWLTLTVVLAFVEPNVLRPPPAAGQVDTTLQIDTIYRVDSLYIIDTTK